MNHSFPYETCFDSYEHEEPTTSVFDLRKFGVSVPMNHDQRIAFKCNHIKVPLLSEIVQNSKIMGNDECLKIYMVELFKHPHNHCVLKLRDKTLVSVHLGRNIWQHDKSSIIARQCIKSVAGNYIEQFIKYEKAIISLCDVNDYLSFFKYCKQVATEHKTSKATFRDLYQHTKNVFATCQRHNRYKPPLAPLGRILIDVAKECPVLPDIELYQPSVEIPEIPKSTSPEISKVPKISNTTIPLLVKRMVWNHYRGEKIGKSKCLCCKTTSITQASFTCGHVVSRKDGGEVCVSNLKPICQNCNCSMGTMNMDDFIKIYEIQYHVGGQTEA